MTNIVIVEDKLKNAMDLAQQLNELAAERPELDIRVKAICLFYEDYKEKNEKENAVSKIPAKDHEYEIKLVSLYDFDDIMDSYMLDQEEPTIAIMDFLLESATDRGARGIPARRVNIRYFRNIEKEVQDRIWFYTTSGIDNVEILCELIGREHVLRADSVKSGRLYLNLKSTTFMETLQAGEAMLQTV